MEEQLEIYLHDNVVSFNLDAIQKLEKFGYYLISKEEFTKANDKIQKLSIEIDKLKTAEYKGALFTPVMIVEMLENIIK